MSAACPNFGSMPAAGNRYHGLFPSPQRKHLVAEVTETLNILIIVVVFVTMTLVGTDCTLEDLRDSLKRPGLMIAVGLGQFLMVPLFMFGCSYLLGVSAIITASLILISSCPAGGISNTYCYLMRGNVSLSVSLTTVSNIVALVATPISLSAARGIIGSHSSGLPLIPVIPMLRELGLMMLVPLVIGIIIRAKIPKWVLAHRRHLRQMALILVIALLVLIIGTEPKEVVRHVREIAVVTVLFTTVLLTLGWLMSLAFRLSAADRWGVLFEFPCRNLSIAAVVGITVLNRPDLVRFAATFFLIQAVIFLALITAVVKRRIPKKEF